MDEQIKEETPSSTNGGVKCPECHAYWVKPGEVCSNCKAGRSRHQLRAKKLGK